MMPLCAEIVPHLRAGAVRSGIDADVRAGAWISSPLKQFWTFTSELLALAQGASVRCLPTSRAVPRAFARPPAYLAAADNGGALDYTKFFRAMARRCERFMARSELRRYRCILPTRSNGHDWRAAGRATSRYPRSDKPDARRVGIRGASPQHAFRHYKKPLKASAADMSDG